MSARILALPTLPLGWTLRRPAGGDWEATNAHYAVRAWNPNLRALVATVHELDARLAAELAASTSGGAS